MSKDVLKTCASCEWVFKKGSTCPKCGFVCYIAYRVYGGRAYTYAKTQKPWRDKKIAEYSVKLDKEIGENLDGQRRI